MKLILNPDIYEGDDTAAVFADKRMKARIIQLVFVNLRKCRIFHCFFFQYIDQMLHRIEIFHSCRTDYHAFILTGISG